MLRLTTFCILCENLHKAKCRRSHNTPRLRLLLRGQDGEGIRNRPAQTSWPPRHDFEPDQQFCKAAARSLGHAPKNTEKGTIALSSDDRPHETRSSLEMPANVTPSGH